MGYRSDIVFAVNKETKMKYGLLLNKLDILNTEADSMYTTADGDTYWQLEHRNWFDGYTDVDAVTDLMNELDSDEDDAINYGFMRLGEDSGDVEERGNCSVYDIYFSQYIDSPSHN